MASNDDLPILFLWLVQQPGMAFQLI